ncbi:hypothetical protein PIB30_081567, partial [Stylosanthes scabra]|nr:hypothetical protein [Stylosanthes scabra]
FLGIEKGIEEAKENIRSKGITRGSHEVRNRAPCGRTVPSSVLTCHWEQFGMKSAQTRAIARSPRAPTRVQSQSCTVPSDIIKIKAKIGISSFQARSKPL